MVALTMNGEPLPIQHGFPARLVVPGLYGYVSATKWLSEIELTTWDGFNGYWIPRGWGKEGPIKTQSRIDVPRQGQRIPPGPAAIAGVAWAPHRGVDRVEVQIDGGTWMEAQLSDDLTDNAWRQWMLEWDAVPGDHEVRVRGHRRRRKHPDRPDRAARPRRGPPATTASRSSSTTPRSSGAVGPSECLPAEAGPLPCS